jgi:hypothetical protein
MKCSEGRKRERLVSFCASRSDALEQLGSLRTRKMTPFIAALVSELTTVLEGMVEEDRAHAAAPAKPWDAMSAQERIAELIFQLREQRGYQERAPGYCDIFLDRADAKDSPAHRLVALGLDAVPALIEILGDRRLMRPVGFHRGHGYASFHILRYGDAAVMILERIAHRSFYEPRSTSSYLAKDGDVSAVRARVEEWWRSVQRDGLAKVLLAQARGEVDNALPAVQRLLEIDPPLGVSPARE